MHVQGTNLRGELLLCSAVVEDEYLGVATADDSGAVEPRFGHRDTGSVTRWHRRLLIV